ncbi:DUF4435 domain-containing protein [Brevibacillus sp. SYP-B805]|uniref:DUF4435 domain-containing protein n=1 Tax=Brevibacillus sp. SYP-B805 TaxID=1578199 RepID=UPI0013EA884A|nr:DUF4435 domain-containing protein [Brevibacillus sp. SYP-B805]NGQ95526.1 DUF4435 domain-containing protein [Brevibacillus sp. SYP-B805]
MDYADKLRERRDSHVVVFRKFVSLFKDNKNDLYCFVEGEDSVYYGPRIYQTYKTNFHFFRCSGKDGVLRLVKMISESQEYLEAKVFYFVDRDFDESINDPKIYETPCYSIENLYTSREVFERILKCEFQLTNVDEDFNKVVDLYVKRQQEFHDAVLLLNAWIACHKERQKNNPNVTKLNLKENLKKEVFYRLVDIKLGQVSQKYSLDDLQKIFPEVGEFSEEELNTKMIHFGSVDRQKTFRGKFEILFLKKILEQIASDANKKSPELFKEKVKNTLNLSGNLLSILSPYAETPECLEIYIRRYLIDQERIGLPIASA